MPFSLLSISLSPLSLDPSIHNEILSNSYFYILALKSWNFDEFVYDEMELLSMTRHMYVSSIPPPPLMYSPPPTHNIHHRFEYFNLLEEFQIKPRTLELFLVNVKEHYFNNPYQYPPIPQSPYPHPHPHHGL